MYHGSNRVLPLPQGKLRETEGRKARGACLRTCQPAAKGYIKTCGENCNGSKCFKNIIHGLVSFPLTLSFYGRLA